MFGSEPEWPGCQLLPPYVRWQKPYYISVSAATGLNWHFSRLFVPDSRVLYWALAKFNGERLSDFLTVIKFSVWWLLGRRASTQRFCILFIPPVRKGEKGPSTAGCLCFSVKKILWCEIHPGKVGLGRTCRDGGPVKGMNKPRNCPMAGWGGLPPRWLPKHLKGNFDGSLGGLRHARTSRLPGRDSVLCVLLLAAGHLRVQEGTPRCRDGGLGCAHLSWSGLSHSFHCLSHFQLHARPGFSGSPRIWFWVVPCDASSRTLCDAGSPLWGALRSCGRGRTTVGKRASAFPAGGRPHCAHVAEHLLKCLAVQGETVFFQWSRFKVLYVPILAPVVDAATWGL